MGSIAGTYLPLVVLVPHLGSRGSLLAAAGLLLLPAAGGLLMIRRPRGALAIALLAGASGALAAAAIGSPVRAAPGRLVTGRPGRRKEAGANRAARHDADQDILFSPIGDDGRRPSALHVLRGLDLGVHAPGAIGVADPAGNTPDAVIDPRDLFDQSGIRVASRVGGVQPLDVGK